MQTSRPKQYGFSRFQFLEAWENSSCAREVSEKLSEIAGEHVPKPIILARASVYRRMGVHLKPLRPRGVSTPLMATTSKGTERADEQVRE